MKLPRHMVQTLTCEMICNLGINLWDLVVFQTEYCEHPIFSATFYTLTRAKNARLKQKFYIYTSCDSGLISAKDHTRFLLQNLFDIGKNMENVTLPKRVTYRIASV